MSNFNAAELEQFTGTEQYYRHFGGLKYTDGIKFLAEKAGCYWLIDVFASYQPRLKNIPFQLWKLTVNPNKSAVVICREDTNEPVLVKQVIPFTDFPMEDFECYVIDGILLLKSEY